jgi:hypothetical protein
MYVLAIDPGNTQSAWLLYDRNIEAPKDFGIESKTELLLRIKNFKAKSTTRLAVLMRFGKSVFDTCVWIDRLIDAWGWPTYTQIYRLDVKMHLCHDSRAKDGNIRQAIIDRYPASGGGKIPQIGTKKQPGLLYGIKKDLWSALAIAITVSEQKLEVR